VHGELREDLVKVVVDTGLCQGHGVCESEAPEVFRVSKDNVVEVLDASPPPDLWPAAKEAAKHCPTQAITLEED
jgi:ferredoxin